jgi:hypothetical protein
MAHSFAYGSHDTAYGDGEADEDADAAGSIAMQAAEEVLLGLDLDDFD